MKKDSEAQHNLMRLISHSRPGSDLDKVVAMILFECRLEPCTIAANGTHMVGSVHYDSQVGQQRICSSPLPQFSTDPQMFFSLLEWVTSRYPGVELVWDSGKWLCNVNGVQNDTWSRLAHSVAKHGMQEALCKALLFAVVNPQNLPLDIRGSIRGGSKPKIEKKPKKRKPK